MKEIDKSLVDDIANKILDLMKKTASKTINTANVEVYHNGIVKSDTIEKNTSGEVDLSIGVSLTIPNLSRVSLTKGDRVKVYSDKQNLADAYIGLKY